MKYFRTGEEKFRLRPWVTFCIVFFLLSAVCPSIAMANFQSSLFSIASDVKAVNYNSSTSQLATPSVVKLADNRVIVVFDLELELATNVADRGAGDGYTFPMAKLARKFSFSDNTLRIVNIALHAHTFSLDDALRTFSVFEIVTDVALSPTATLSYNPAFEEDDSFVLAVPSTQSLLAGFTNISPVAPAATLTEIELGDALRGLTTRKILDAASPPQINDEAFACFEVVLSDDIPETTITFIPSDNSVLWTTDFGAPRNGSGVGTNAINLNPGVNKATITLGTGENPISYTAFIIRDVDTAPALRSLKVTPISDQAGQPQSIPLTQGQLAYYINFQSNATGVQVAPEADAGVSVFVNDVPLQGGVSGTIALSIGSANKINIRLVDAENHETTYSLYVTRGNEAILTGLKLTKVDEGDRGGGVTPYIEVPIRHAGSDENGYIQDGERDASGWQQYVADANRSGSFAGVEFYLEPTFNAGTRVFVSNVKKTKLDPADEVVADAEGVFRSKPFVLNYRGEELTLYLTMFRQRPGGTDWIMSDSSVAVSIVTEPVQSKLTQIIVRDGATYEQLLALSGDELMVSTQNSITTSKFAKSIVVEVARTSTDLVFTPDFSFTPEDSGALRFRSDVKFSAYGEEKELTIKTIDSHTQDEKIYKLNVTQGHPPYVILGLSSDEVFKYDPSKIRLDVNGAPFEGLYDLETGEAIRTVKVPHLPSRTDADGNTVLTVDWAMSPPTGDLNVEFALTEFSKSGYWRIQNITKNANGRGGTLELVLLKGDGGEFRQRRTYTDMTSQTLHTVGLVARLYKSGKLLALNYSEFAKVVDNLFKDIVIDVIENTKPIIKSEKDRYPEDKRLPIIDFKLWGVSYAEDSDNKRIGLQVGRTYKIPLVYSVVTTYGDYREYVRKHPDMGERYPYVFAAGESTPIPVLLEDLRTRNDPGYSPNMMDNRPLDFSHDKITYSMSNEDSNRWYVKTEDYFHIDQEAGTITVLKGNSGSFALTGTTERLGEKRTVYIETIAEDATKNSKAGYLSYVAIYPQLVYFGFDGAYKLNPGYDGYDLTKTPMMSIWDMRIGSNAEIGRVIYNNIPKHALKTIHSSMSYNGADLRWTFWEGEGWNVAAESLESFWQGGEYWRNSKTRGNHPFGFNIRRYLPKSRELVLETLYNIIDVGFTGLYLSAARYPFMETIRGLTMEAVELAGPYVLKLEVSKENIDSANRGEQIVPKLEANIIVVCSDPSEDSNSPKSSAALSRMIMAKAAGEVDDGEVREVDLSSFEYDVSPSGDAFLLTDGYTAFNMSYSPGASEGTPVTADEIEWAVPIIPGAQNIQVGDFDGVPVSSDYSLFLEEAKKPKGRNAASARGASSEEAPNASFQIKFSAPKADLANMEFFDFYFKLKGDDTIYSAPPEGTGENGGVRLHPYYLEAEQQAQKANSGSGCSAAGTVGTVTLLSLAGASLLFAGKRRKK